jgi:N6-L-threonylcarbamoyladenine synthase
VSGGHTSLSYHERHGVTMLGETVDDAVGEAYDKAAKILGLGYPGGPILDRLASKGNPQAIRFTKPKQENRFDFSFSGIKTAVLYEVGKRRFGLSSKAFAGTRIRTAPEKESRLPKTFVWDVAASFQTAVVGWLVEKALDAACFKNVRDIVVGGGVSANSLLRKSLKEEGEKRGLRVWFPSLSLTMDNAAMIARRGLEIYCQGKQASLTLTGDPNLKVA